MWGYNENEPYAAQWLRNLITAGYIAPGIVDNRDIRDIAAEDLKGFVQYHFFAGIGIWSAALRAAGWPDWLPVWTGSCPCQPFSGSGQRRGFADERHLWPVWSNLIGQCRPDCVVGEQVSSPDGLEWFDLVSDDLEDEGYTVAALDTCAAGVGAPHIRQRLYWVAIADEQRLAFRELLRSVLNETNDTSARQAAVIRGDAGGLADSTDIRHQWRRTGEASSGQNTARFESERFCDTGGLADSDGRNTETAWIQRGRQYLQRKSDTVIGVEFIRTGTPDSYWRNADWLFCRDAKWRPVESGTFPLASGYPSRVGRLRAYGNALCLPQAAAFVRSVMEVLAE